MWKESNRNIVVIFQPNILRIVGFYVRHSANVLVYPYLFLVFSTHTLFTALKGYGSTQDVIDGPHCIIHEHSHCGFLEHWNSQKSLCNIWQRFSCLLDESIEKKRKKNFFHGGLFFKSTLSVLRCTWTGQIIWKKFWDIILTI